MVSKVPLWCVFSHMCADGYGNIPITIGYIITDSGRCRSYVLSEGAPFLSHLHDKLVNVLANPIIIMYIM